MNTQTATDAALHSVIDMEPAAGQLVAPPPTDSAALSQVVTPPKPAGSIMDLIEIAVRAGKDLEYIRQLMDLSDRMEARQAAAAYNAAFARFKATAIEIIKTKQVSFAKANNQTTEYKHAELADIVGIVSPLLSGEGLSANWSMPAQSETRITVRCTIRHAMGHSESVEAAGPYEKSNSKNDHQALQSAVSYLSKTTLKMILGLAEKGEDDDGHGAQGSGRSQKEIDADAAEAAMLKRFRDEAMNGYAALKALFDKESPPPDFWVAYKRELLDAARKADATNPKAANPAAANAQQGAAT